MIRQFFEEQLLHGCQMPRMFADHYRASFPITDASKGKKLHAEQVSN